MTFEEFCDLLKEFSPIVTELAILISTLTPVMISLKKISNGTKCQLRSEMLRIYYKHKDEKKLKQYEFENFDKLYQAYKTLKGNSFVDKIYTEIKKWDIRSGDTE